MTKNFLLTVYDCIMRNIKSDIDVEGSNGWRPSETIHL